MTFVVAPPKHSKLAAVIVVIAVVNAVTFLVVSQIIGGSAFSGYQKSAHYFLGSHGQLTEVGAGVFAYSWWHSLSFFMTGPLFIGMGALNARQRRRESRRILDSIMRQPTGDSSEASSPQN